jgi:hypothetical protein
MPPYLNRSAPSIHSKPVLGVFFFSGRMASFKSAYEKEAGEKKAGEGRQ